MASTAAGGRIALRPYLERIEYVGDLSPTLQTLEALHLAHATHIPFENIDVLLGRGVSLDLEALQRKLVTDRRGGYCFEHNLLFATVLEDLGFDVVMLSARVRLGAVGVRPRTHMVLMVTFGDRRWIADVGFGSEGLLRPVRFEPGAESVQFLWTYRVVAGGPLWVLQSRRGDGWNDLYAFSLDAHERIDYEVLNHYTATHPRSIFRARLFASRATPERRVVLEDRNLSIDTGSTITTRTVAEEDLLGVLRETLGLALPAGTILGRP